MDEIVFDDVTFREPHKLRRPDRDRRFACLAYELPRPGDLAIFLDAAASEAIERHALRDTSVELGGILLGKECVDDQTGEPFVWVTQSLEAKHYENTQASFTYTHDSWGEITRERDQLYPDLDIVGWYHTHPDFGIFLSGMDLFIHRNYFNQPLQVAYVVDPINQTRGFFQWNSGDLAEVGGFWIITDRTQRSQLARVVNDLEGIPNTDPSGGGLSPRLEAELIAMLTRPAPHTIVNSSQSTLTTTLFGMLIGMVGMLGVTWILALNRQVQEQTVAITAVGRSVERTADAQRLALDTLMPTNGNIPAREILVENYGKAIKKVDEQTATNSALANELKRLSEDSSKTEAKLTRALSFEADAKAADKLRAAVSSLEADVKKKGDTINEQSLLLDRLEDAKSGELWKKYTWAWYLAVIGWIIAVLTGLRCIALWASPAESPKTAVPITVRIE